MCQPKWLYILVMWGMGCIVKINHCEAHLMVTSKRKILQRIQDGNFVWIVFLIKANWLIFYDRVQIKTWIPLLISKHKTKQNRKNKQINKEMNKNIFILVLFCFILFWFVLFGVGFGRRLTGEEVNF